MPAAGHALARAALDASELLDVDVDQLARPLALVADGGLQAQRPSLPIPSRVRIPDTVESGHLEQLGDLRAGEPQPAQRGDRLDPALVGAIGDDLGRRGPIQQPGLALGPVASDPLEQVRAGSSAAAAALSDQPCSITRKPSVAAASMQRRVSVQLHPVSSLELGASHHPASKEARMNNLLRNYT